MAKRPTRGYLTWAPKSRSPNVDEIAVERACQGDFVELTLRERAEAVRRMTERGMSGREIAERLRVCDRTVLRWRAVMREAS